MSLDALIERFTERTNDHMHLGTRNQLRAELSEIVDAQDSLNEYQRLELNEARASLTYRSLMQEKRGQMHEPYQEMASELDALTSDVRFLDDSSRKGFDILTNSHSHYVTRFEALREHFQSGSHYTDALLCREHLRKDPYLRRKARRDDAFKAQLDGFVEEFDEYIDFQIQQNLREYQFDWFDADKRQQLRDSQSITKILGEHVKSLGEKTKFAFAGGVGGAVYALGSELYQYFVG